MTYAKESPVQTKNVQVEVPSALPEIPIGIINQIHKLETIRVFFECYEKNVTEHYSFMHTKIAEITDFLYNAKESICELFGEDLRSLICDSKNLRTTLFKNCTV
jgi:hypothetical protein